MSRGAIQVHRLLSLFLVPIVLVLAIAVAQRVKERAASQPGAPTGEQASTATTVSDPDWLPPSWLPRTEGLALAGLDARGPTQGPRVRSRSAFVYDVDGGRVLFEQRADELRPIASLTKVVSALTLVANGGDLDREVCIGAEHYPTRSGARSRLSTGDCAEGHDLLAAALIASDNRAAYGLAALADLDVDEFVAGMNDVARELGMSRSSFSDPSGLEDDNLSTARDLARATVALAALPEVAQLTSAPTWDLARSRSGPRRLSSTNQLLAWPDLDVVAAKTGYTDTARYCFTTLVQTTRGDRVVMTFLGAEGEQTRWADVRRVLTWLGGQDLRLQDFR